jgi:hypothetical protein
VKMTPKFSFELIDEEAFDSISQQYNGVIPEKLEELDEQRYNTIPAVVKDRGEDPMLSKEEVATLVKWKLYVPMAISLSTYLSLLA